MGYLYKRKDRDGTPRGPYWVKYYINGRPVRESTGTEQEAEARRFLRAREGRVATGAPLLPRADRVRFDEIARDLREYYETTGTRRLKEVRARFDHLAAFFAGHRVAGIGAADVVRYVKQRQDQQAANGTVNRELAVLSKMLRLAYENGKLLRLPVIRKLKEAAPRAGFFEREAYESVQRHLPDDLRVADAIAYTYG